MNFNSTVDVIMVRSYVDSFLDPACVPVRISIDKLDFVPNKIVASLEGVFRNGGGLGTGDSYIPVVFFEHGALLFAVFAPSNDPHEFNFW